MRILHISDVHVQIDYSERPWRKIGWRRVAAQLELKLARRARRYENAPQTIRRLLKEGEKHGVDHVILSGDLTALALDEEFEGVRDALGALADRSDKLTVIPGNHDVFTPGSHRKKRFDSWFGHLLDSDLPELRGEDAWPHVRFVGDEVAVIGLCSARVPAVPGLAAGTVGEEQLVALMRILAHPKVKGRTIHVVVHHAPLRPDGKLDRRDHGLSDALRLLEACRLGNVATVLCGHIHKRFSYQLMGGPRIVCGGSSTWLGNEGYWILESEGGRLSGLHEHALEPEVVGAPVALPAPAGVGAAVAAASGAVGGVVAAAASAAIGEKKKDEEGIVLPGRTIAAAG